MVVGIDPGRAVAAQPMERGEARQLGADLFGYIECIQRMHDTAQIAEVVAQQLAHFGITYFVFSRLAHSTEAFQRGQIIARMHPGWTQRFYAQRDADNNSCLTGRWAGDEPLFWSEAESFRQADARLMRIYRDAQEFGITDGICIPINCPGRFAATASLSGERVDTSPTARAAMRAITLCTHSRLVRIRALETAHRTRLSRREADCLAWVAKGKTDWEIGEILGISESTAHWYVERAKRRLGVSTRIQAVVGAIQEGLIAP
jgi:LuxR family transcriptional regulator, quorum-sensing system regulator BjaR1